MRRQIPFAKSGHQVHNYAFIGTQKNLETTRVDRFPYGVSHETHLGIELHYSGIMTQP